MKPVLTASNLSIGYKKSAIHQALDFSLYEGEMLALLGPNGAGKSTLIRSLAGMQRPLAGIVQLLGDDVQAMSSRDLAQSMSLVLTERAELGLLTGYALVALGRHPYTDWTGKLSQKDEMVIRWAVEAVGAQDLAPRYVTELSDGERQKLMIARALAQEPAVMILDEPTAFLDLPRRVELMQLLKRLAHETGRAILLSTHDLDLALRHSDRLMLLPKKGEMQIGSPEDLVLNGAFESVFHSEGLHFDVATGTFHIKEENIKEISLIGEGIRRIWTERALERAGYTLVLNAPQQIKVLEHTWQLTTNNTYQEFSQLFDLLQAIK